MAFFQSYKSVFIYIVCVFCAVLILRFLTNLLHKGLLKHEQKKFPQQEFEAVHLVKRILNVLWIVLGILSLSLIFVNEDTHSSVIDDLKLVFYLGVLSVLTIVGASSVNRWFKMSIKRKIANLEDPTSFKFLSYVMVFGIYSLGLLFGLLAFPSFRGIAQTALGGAGVLAIIAGVASQEALSNLVGGIFIISFKPFKIGDTVKVTDDMVGTVTDITLRHTVIRNFENKMIVIPNAIINKEKLINYNLGELKCCELLEIGISYDSDVTVAKKIMQEECTAHPLIYDNRSFDDKANNLPIVKVALTRFNDSSVTIRAWAWAANFSNAFQLKCDVLESIKMRFEQEGIEIPYPYRTIVIKKEKATIVDSIQTKNGK